MPSINLTKQEIALMVIGNKIFQLRKAVDDVEGNPVSEEFKKLIDDMWELEKKIQDYVYVERK